MTAAAMPDPGAQWIAWLAAVSLGAFVAMLAWWTLRLLPDPPPDPGLREYRDPPPLGLRMVWWPIHWSERLFDRVMKRERRAFLASQLRRAGLEYSLTPAQFTAAQAAFAGVAMLVTSFLLGLIALAGPLDGAIGEQSGGIGFWRGLLWVLGAGVAGAVMPRVWLRDRIQRRRREFIRALPFFLDIVTLCVEVGLNTQGAIAQAVAKGPRGYLRDEFQRVLRDIRAGKSRGEALRDMGDRVRDPALSQFTSCVIQAERMGMSLGPMLRLQSEQRLSERFMRAEKLALEAPVKMLFPLIACIFPCTFIVLLFPIAVSLMGSTP